MATAATRSHFERTLLSFAPEKIYELTRLSGGLINDTVRARCRHESFIMKYAPPYMAAIGPSASFGQERQIVEAEALSLFTPWLDGALSSISRNSHVCVPSSLLFDQENHVLCMTDFGESISLTDFLSSITQTLVSLNHARDIGYRLGAFFARLHCPSTFKIVKASQSGRRIIENTSEGKNVVRQMIIDPIADMMIQGGVSVTDAKSLASVVQEAWEHSAREPGIAFTFGDAWTGSVLLRVSEDKLQVALIDWEFVSFSSSGICSDVAMLIAHLKLRHIAADSVGCESLAIAISSLTQEMAKTYRRHSIEASTHWTECLYAGPESENWQHLARDLCISIGRDMIHNAFQMKFDCLCCRADAQGDNCGKCALKTSMVQQGVGFLRTASTSSPAEIIDSISSDATLKHLIGRGIKTSM